MTAIAAADSPAEGSRWPDWLGFKTIVFFFSTKAVRSGPKYMIQIAIVLIVGFVLTRLLLPYRLAEGLDYNQVVDWVTGDQAAPVEDGGLRIVVFGEPDIATPPRLTGSKHEDIGPSWTERVCEELECSEHLSFVPTSDGPVQSLASNSLYETTLGNLLSRTRHNPEPGMNYTWMKELYPPPNRFPDLKAQVDAFLSMEKPALPPRETLYIFSFGMWDVWHVAGLPLEDGYAALADFTRHIFHQIEELYEESTNRESIAFSAGQPNKTTTEPDTFRVIVPRLFDPSMIPGWKFRSTPPAPHSNSEHLKNSAYLTMRWNWEMNNQIQNWIHKSEKDLKMRVENNKVSANADIPASETTAETINGAATPAPQTIPPIRDVIVPDVASYLVNSMIDSQMKYSGLVDHTPGSKLGQLPSRESFADGSSACMSFREAVSEKYKMDGSGAACNKHLYLSEFSVTQRAIREIGIDAADMVTGDESIRSLTAKGKKAHKTPSWKTKSAKKFD